MAEDSSSSNPLLSRLRANPGVIANWYDLRREAADEIEHLTAERDDYQTARDAFDKAIAERDNARDEAERMRRTRDAEIRRLRAALTILKNARWRGDQQHTMSEVNRIAAEALAGGADEHDVNSISAKDASQRIPDETTTLQEDREGLHKLTRSWSGTPDETPAARELTQVTQAPAVALSPYTIPQPTQNTFTMTIGGPAPVYTANTPICPKCGQIDVRIPRMGIYHVCPPENGEGSHG